MAAGADIHGADRLYNPTGFGGPHHRDAEMDKITIIPMDARDFKEPRLS